MCGNARGRRRLGRDIRRWIGTSTPGHGQRPAASGWSPAASIGRRRSTNLGAPRSAGVVPWLQQPGTGRIDKKSLPERDVCSKFVSPALTPAGWDSQRQGHEAVYFNRGRVIVHGRLHSRGVAHRADYLLYHQPNLPNLPNLPIAIIEAKDNLHAVGAGMQQALGYADAMNAPFAFTSNGDGFVFHDRTGTGAGGQVETLLDLDEFPSSTELWRRYCARKTLDPVAQAKVEAPYFDDGAGRLPRYCQVNAINRAVAAVAHGQNRILLVMATGTGKTYTAFQIIWRLWKSRQKKRILFLADRNILVDQTRNNDFKLFGPAMTKRIGKLQTADRQVV